MSEYKIKWDSGDEDEETFASYEDADEMAQYYQACADDGAETLNLSNPGDWPYDEDEFERPGYEIVEV